MATNYEKTPLGVRLAAFRKRAGFSTAEALADAIPSERVTRATIVSIELGRSRDPSMSVIMLIASALQISPLELMFDLSRPWEPLELTGMAKPYADMTTIEYVAQMQVLDFRNPNSGPALRGYGDIVASLSEAELYIRVAATIEASVDSGARWKQANGIWTQEGPKGPGVWTISSYYGSTHFDRPDQVAKEAVVGSYVELISALGWMGGLQESRLEDISSAVWERINVVGDEVERYLTDVPSISLPKPEWSKRYARLPRLRHQDHLQRLFRTSTADREVG